MTPLLIAGATSVAKYLVSRAESHAPALPSSGNTKDFSAVLRAALGPQPAGVSSETQARSLERQLLEAPEVKAALAAGAQGAGAAIQVQQDGSITVMRSGGRADISLGAATRVLAQQVFNANSAAVPSSAFLTDSGVSAISIAVPSARTA